MDKKKNNKLTEDLIEKVKGSPSKDSGLDSGLDEEELDLIKNPFGLDPYGKRHREIMDEAAADDGYLSSK